MPRTYIKVEYFQFIEQVGSVSVNAFADKFGLQRNYAASWLSKWTGRNYLTHLSREGIASQLQIRTGKRGRPKGLKGLYVLGPKWWGDLVFGSEVEAT